MRTANVAVTGLWPPATFDSVVSLNRIARASVAHEPHRRRRNRRAARTWATSFAAKKRRKAIRKDKAVLVRVTEAQKETLAKAAEKAGLGLSSWMLTVALKEAERSGGS